MARASFFPRLLSAFGGKKMCICWPGFLERVKTPQRPSGKGGDEKGKTKVT